MRQYLLAASDFSTRKIELWEQRLLLSIQSGGKIKGISKFSSELVTHFVVESNGLVVTKQLMLGNLVGKH